MYPHQLPRPATNASVFWWLISPPPRAAEGDLFGRTTAMVTWQYSPRVIKNYLLGTILGFAPHYLIPDTMEFLINHMDLRTDFASPKGGRGGLVWPDYSHGYLAIFTASDQLLSFWA